MRAEERISAEIIDQLESAIVDAGGNEVFAAGKLGPSGLVEKLFIAARGSKNAVPALAPFLETGDVLIHNHPNGELEPSEADLAVASREGDKGIGSFIVDNAVERVYVIAEPIKKKKNVRLEPGRLAELLEEGGSLSRSIESYESRPSQIGLLKLVAKAFNEDAVCAAEAGTGVGKSFAYLIPAMDWAQRNEERVVISTGTINLQHQLIEKDIPAVNAARQKPVKAVLVKGRANYLCKTRLIEALEEEGLFADPEGQLRKIADWSESSLTGSRSDLSFQPEEGIWGRVCSEADFCLNLKCGHREGCFVLRMKREAADAKILVTNHHLLFSDLSARLSGAGWDTTAVLPPFTRIILDEAHNIEANATSYFSQELARFTVLKQISRLFREKKGSRYGVLIQVKNLAGTKKKAFAAVPELIALVRDQVEAADERALELLRKEGSFRVVGEKSKSIKEDILEPLAELERRILALLDALQDGFESIPEDKAEEVSVYELRAIMRRLGEAASICSKFQVYDEKPESVFWLSRGRTSSGEPFAEFIVTPINISPMMREAVFEPYPTVVCTSATLTVGGRFDYWMSRVGLSMLGERPVETGIFPSPFPYKTNVLLGVPRDAPMPEAPGYSAFLIKAVREILTASEGHALVLFTNYESLKSVHEAVKPHLAEMGIVSLKQGEDDRTRLLSNFKADSSSVLFATDSFWEGVDAPGDTLQVVVIAKLPFKVPTDPVQKARAEAIERQGGNSFMDMSLPEAVTRLKQGFGRLIRRSTDKGAVIVLDSRIVNKRYGSIFVESLPETRMSIKPQNAMIADLENFLYEGKGS